MMGELPPTGTKFALLQNSQEFYLKSVLISLTSSRNTVPAWACSNIPGLFATAPVKDP